jgi:AbrB family looped-hinge helix DNA binding protein
MAIGMLFCQLLTKTSGSGGNMQTTIDRFGRIVLPKKLRDDFNLEPGSQIQIEESGQKIILKPIHGEPNLRLKDGVLVFTGVPLGDLDKAVAKHRDERLQSFGK